MLTFETIVKKSQVQLKRALVTQLKSLGYNPLSTNGYVYAAGTAPVLLVAHLDTVHKSPVKTICRSAGGNIIMSPEGIGGDDRAGVYMILRIIEDYNCHVLFCEDEEVGGVGACAFAASGIVPNVNYIIELDRRGSNDAVFYDHDDAEFTRFITSFGFAEKTGSFSDISIVAPELGIAAVNISAGYYNEHTRYEYVDMLAVENNIKRVSKMINTKTNFFPYMRACYDYIWKEEWNLEDYNTPGLFDCGGSAKRRDKSTRMVTKKAGKSNGPIGAESQQKTYPKYSQRPGIFRLSRDPRI
jgi:hypothetical protein